MVGQATGASMCESTSSPIHWPPQLEPQVEFPSGRCAPTYVSRRYKAQARDINGQMCSQTTFPTSAHAFLVDQLMEVAGECALPVNAQVVLARDREDGVRYALRPESTLLMGTYRHSWRTSEEILTRMQVLGGYKVALLHIDKGEEQCLTYCLS
jgi:hypothetical protein